MDIDMGALRALEREREISLPVLLDAIRSALHAAYLHTDHPVRDSEVLIDESTGEVAVIARERDGDGTVYFRKVEGDALNLLRGRLPAGSSIGLHPVFVLISVTVFGHFGGLIGMLLPVPAAGIIQVFIKKWAYSK